MQRTTYRPPVADDSLYEPVPDVLLNRYRVIETNDDGGFGSVFICWDSNLQRRVAIKRIPLSVDEDSPQRAASLKAARNEARTLGLLKSSNTVTMYDFQADDRYSYLVMEYVDGMSLAELLARVEDGLLSFDECAHVVQSVAAALSVAHSNRVLHLDIKPANILIDHSGTVKLADFGIAKLSSAAGYGGALGGTVGYMPPEQIEGDYVDERSDIFSLAVVVWESLMGTSPFAAATTQKSLELIRRGPAVKLSQKEPELAGTVENTLLRALDPNPTARMSTIEDFAKVLVPALGDPKEGAASLADLLSQAPDEPQDDPQSLDLSLYDRVPWLQKTSERVVCAFVAGLVAYQTLPILAGPSIHALALGTAGSAILGALWPPSCGILGMLLIAGALLAQPAQLAFPLALVVAFCGLTWWAIAGRRQAFANPAMLVPACFGSPLAGASISGFALTPGVALITGSCSYLLSIFVINAVNNGYAADTLVLALRDVFFDSTTWTLTIGCGIAAWLCSLISRHRGPLASSLGQAVLVAILVFAYVMCAHGKNESVTDALDIPALAIAVFLGATLCIASALAGQSAIPLKGDDRS